MTEILIAFSLGILIGAYLSANSEFVQRFFSMMEFWGGLNRGLGLGLRFHEKKRTIKRPHQPRPPRISSKEGKNGRGR